MTEVAELLASVAETAPVQRVRNYYLTDREARPHPQDFLTAMKRTDGALCVRWTEPPAVSASDSRIVPAESGTEGDRFVRYDDPGWECAKLDRFRERTTVEALDADRLRAWFRERRPELVAYADVRGWFETSPDAERGPSADPRAATDGGPVTGATVTVGQYADLLDDPTLDRADADALSAALPTPAGAIAVWLPLVLAEEAVLESTAGSDRVFVAEVVPERETDCAYYVRQDCRGCWVPKGEARVYELADGAVGAPTPTERPESA